MLTKLIMFLCHIEYKRHKQPIFYIRGIDKDYPKYLLYTENKDTYRRMNKF